MLENRFRGGRGAPVTPAALMDISRRFNDVLYSNTLAAYKAAHDKIVGPYRDVVAAKFQKKCGKKSGVAASIMRALEGATIRPTVEGNVMTITKVDGASVVFKTSSAELFTAYWDILHATDPLLEAILNVGKDAETAEACITELNKVAAYDTGGHVKLAHEKFGEVLAAAGRVFGV